MTTRRLLYIATPLIVILIAFLIGYFFRYRASAPQTTQSSSGTQSVGGLPVSGNQRFLSASSSPASSSILETFTTSSAEQEFGLLAPEPAENYFIQQDNTVIIVQPDGKIAQVSQGNSTIISSSPIDKLISTDFSADGGRVVAVFGSPYAPQSSVFDVSQKSWTPLPAGIFSPVWAPLGARLAYITDKTGLKTISSLDMSNPKAKPITLFQMHAEDISIAWTTPVDILIFEKGSAYADSSAWMLDLKKNTLMPIAMDMPGFDIAWSRSTSSLEGGLIFGTKSSERGGTLFIASATSSPVQLGALTIPSKCGFYDAAQPTSTAITSSTAGTASSTAASSSPKSGIKKALLPPPPIPYAVCGIPADISTANAATLPDDYFERSFLPDDTLYAINMQDGSLREIISESEAGIAFDAWRVKMFGDRAYFINRFDNKVYGALLPQQ